MAGVVGRGRGKHRQLYLNNSKILKNGKKINLLKTYFMAQIMICLAECTISTGKEYTYAAVAGYGVL